ncbi:MAG TPA: hypothetical protein VLB87_11990 [Pyrinomonadaceae bacterium]|nr:hypothetical protein [Pyrinomonadaceae bacterium]
MKNSGKRESNVVDIGSVTTGKLNAEVDELFKLPLAEFTSARNALAARLKQSGRANDANLVKTLSKPSVSAWTVNQLYWNHRKAFDSLLAAGQRIRKAQTSGLAGKGMRESLDARREVLVQLSDLATSLLTEAGHNPGPDTIRRVTTTLEAISALGSPADGPTLGRLSQDVDPPGFESLASFMAGAFTTKASSEPARTSSKVSVTAKSRETGTAKASRAVEDTRQARQLEEMRQARIVAAKLSLQAAKKSLADARANAQSLDIAQRKAHAEAKQAEKQVREAEERLKKANIVLEAATERAHAIAAEAEQAAKVANDSKRAVDKATKELEALFGES